MTSGMQTHVSKLFKGLRPSWRNWSRAVLKTGFSFLKTQGLSDSDLHKIMSPFVPRCRLGPRIRTKLLYYVTSNKFLMIPKTSTLWSLT